MHTMLLTAAMVVALGTTTDLSYRPSVGAKWTVHSKTVATIPMVGVRELEASYDVTCRAANEEQRHMALHMPKATLPNGKVVGPIDATFDLAADGTVTALQSPQLGDPQLGPLVRNVNLLFPPLPGGTTEVGATWTTRQVLYLPPLRGDAPMGPKVARLPDKVRLDGTLEFRRRDAIGRAIIGVTLREAPGEAVKVTMTGEGKFDPDDGYGTMLYLKGEIKVRQAGMTFTIPIVIQTW